MMERIIDFRRSVRKRRWQWDFEIYERPQAGHGVCLLSSSSLTPLLLVHFTP